MTTEVIPPAPAEQPDPAAAQEPPKRKRRGWLIALIVAVVLLVLLVVTFFIVDAVAKSYARDYVADRIIAVLGLPADAEVDVDLGGGSIILQALTGRVAQVDVGVPEVAFGELSGAATVHAEGVPLDANAPVESLDIRFQMTEEALAPLADNISGLELQSLTLEEPEIFAATEFDLFGFLLPVSMGLEPGAEDGRVTFTPTTIRIGEDEYSAPELAENPFFAALAGPLLQQQQMCVAQELPRALTITDVVVTGEHLVVSIDGDGAALGGPDLSTPGTCE
jgi:hypothetical protein